MPDFRMDKTRPINNNSGATKIADTIINIDRTDGAKQKQIRDGSPAKKGTEFKVDKDKPSN